MSYRDASLEFETATGIHVPKRTIHSFVQEIAPRLLEANRTTTRRGIVMRDSTKVRAVNSGEMNDVHILLSGCGRMLDLEVNEECPRSEAEILISDNEPGSIDLS